MTWSDFLNILFGAVIGFLLSIFTTIINFALERKGKLKIYYKIYTSENLTEEFGFSFEAQKIAFIVPITFEMQNTSNSSRVIRDLSIHLFNKGNDFKKMRQVGKAVNERTTDGVVVSHSEQEFGTYNNSYSFVIPARSIRNHRCVYMYVIEKDESNKNQFDEIKLSYYDENDRKHLFDIRMIPKCWEKNNKLDVDSDWVLASK